MSSITEIRVPAFKDYGVPLSLPVADPTNTEQTVANKMREISSPVNQVHIQPKWHEKAIQKIEGFEITLEARIPNHPIQLKIDQLAQKIETKFAKLTKFNEWLNSNGHGDWYRRLATFMVKLPLLAVRNILSTLYTIVKTALYSAVHPLKATTKLAAMLVQLAHAMTMPETYINMGASTMGTCLGHSAITGNLLTLTGVGLGGAMMLGGMSLKTLEVVLKLPEGEKFQGVKQEWIKQVKQIPEPLLIGFFIAVVVGAIQRVMTKNKPAIENKPSAEKATVENKPIEKAPTETPPASKAPTQPPLKWRMEAEWHWVGNEYGYYTQAGSKGDWMHWKGGGMGNLKGAEFGHYDQAGNWRAKIVVLSDPWLPPLKGNGK